MRSGGSTGAPSRTHGAHVIDMVMTQQVQGDQILGSQNIDQDIELEACGGVLFDILISIGW